LKWELRAEPGLKKTEDIVAKSSNIFTTGAAEPKEKLQSSEGGKLDHTVSRAQLHFCVVISSSLLISARLKTLLSRWVQIVAADEDEADEDEVPPPQPEQRSASRHTWMQSDHRGHSSCDTCAHAPNQSLRFVSEPPELSEVLTARAPSCSVMRPNRVSGAFLRRVCGGRGRCRRRIGYCAA